MPAIAVDPERLISDLTTLRGFGAAGTGVARTAFSDADIAARRWLRERMETAGLKVTVDRCGNLFGLPPGDGPCILVGSHSDTQPLGGWLDGAYGVVCGLELARAALGAGGPPVAMVAFQDEEGRFGGLTGSGVWSGVRTLDATDRLLDSDRVSFATARARAAEIGPLAEVPPSRFSAFVEPHIEQGPVLDSSGQAIGIVDDIVGVRSLWVDLVGETNHAGTTPMALRRDAVQCLVTIISGINAAFAELAGPVTVWTMGRITVDPNADSIVPGVAGFSIQIRDPDTARLDAMRDRAAAIARARAEAADIDIDVAEGLWCAPVPMDRTFSGHLATVAQAVAPGCWRRMPSGALHDASHVSTVLPTAMLFVPSIGGISHNPAEDTDPEHLKAGLAVLARALPDIAAGAA